MSTELFQALEEVARRFRRVRLWSTLAACWLAWGLLGVALASLLARASTAPLTAPTMVAAYLGLAAATGLLGAAVVMRTGRDRRWVARRIEARHPDLGTGLLAAVEAHPAAPGGSLNYLQTAVIRGALDHRRANGWDETVPSWSIRAAKLAHLLALGLLLIAASAMASQARSRPLAGLDLASVVAAYGLEVEPGDVEIERGSPLLVVARFGGLVPADASLVVDDGSGSDLRRVMTRSLEDPTFAVRLDAVDADLTYRVEFDGARSEPYRVTVFEYPAVVRIDASLVFPAYTAIEPKTVEDIRHVTAVEGTELTLTCHLNKPVASAWLVDRAGRELVLSPGDREGVYQAIFTLTDSLRLRAQLVDAEGRPNHDDVEVAVNVTRNQPPVVKIARPGRDVRVSPVEELVLSAEVEDDFGLTRHGLSYTLAGGEPREIELGSSAGKQAEAEHLLAFESLQVEPDQLLTYHFWAEDVGPDGQPRRTSGDMYFAEVRPFEEIFRQGEQPPGGSQQGQGQQGANAEQAMELAELQKEIINGTWALIRRENRPQPSDRFDDDSALLVESQQAALEQAAQLAENLQDPQSQANLEQATDFMKEAAGRLEDAAGSSTVDPLHPALAAEQAAYQALLRLRDREFNVVRGNPGQQGGGASSGPSQRQLQQLELTDDQNRYEQQRSARAEQEAAAQQEQRETRQILNRLRELARRQADLNERLKELQSALEAAEDEEARQEIERQLKRLREQEQQILRDTDELRERMESEENRDRLADARQQVEQGREHVRRASEALEEGRLSQALTEGTRANRQMEDLREQIRRESSDRFSEELTSMRDQARQLAETQGELTEQLGADDQGQRRSLREGEELQQARQRLAEQREQLDDLLDRMRTTVQDAEETEPLMAEDLFDAVQEATEQSLPEALEAAERLAELGITQEAARASRLAGRGLEQLRDGVEQAAERVLGDETEALRLAQGELEELAEQLDREIARSTGRQPGESEVDPDAPEPDPSRDGEPADGPRQTDPGQPQGGQSSEDQPGEPQPGSGQAPPGEPGSERPQEGQGGGEQQGQQDRQGGPQGRGGQEGQPSPSDQPGRGSLRGSQDEDPNPRPGGGGSALDRLLGGFEGGNRIDRGGPITGEGFVEWSDRMRDVEELLDDPELRAEAARIRDRARAAREEYRRHAAEPDWTKLEDLVAAPIHELRDRVAEEVRRRESPDSLVPIDRDPVPPQFAEAVRRYYERLGSGR